MSIIYKSQFAPPIAFWTLDETSGTRYDISGNGYNLNSINNVGYDSGKINNCAIFDGSNYLNTVGSAPGFGNRSLSISFWVKTNSSSDNMLVDAHTGNNPHGGGYGIDMMGDGRLDFLVTHGPPYWFDPAYGNRIQSNSTINDGNWHHLVGTYHNGNMKLYIDGVLDSSHDYNDRRIIGGNGSNHLSIGSNSDGTYGNAQASIDIVGIWQQALDQYQVLALYNNGLGTQDPSVVNVTNNFKLISRQAKPLAFWTLDETSGTRYDLISNLEITETGGTVDSGIGLISNAAQFTNGDQAWLTLPAGICDIGNNGQGQKTYSIWFKINQNNVGYQWIWCQGNSYDYSDVMPCYIEGDGTISSLFQLQGGYGWNWNGGRLGWGTGITPTVGEWHHVVNTFDGNKAKFYYDGELKNTVDYTGYSIITSNTQYTLGHYNAYPDTINNIGGTPFDGEIDAVGIWKHALDQYQILALYNNGLGTQDPSVVNLTNIFKLISRKV